MTRLLLIVILGLSGTGPTALGQEPLEAGQGDNAGSAPADLRDDIHL